MWAATISTDTAGSPKDHSKEITRNGTGCQVLTRICIEGSGLRDNAKSIWHKNS